MNVVTKQPFRVEERRSTDPALLERITHEFAARAEGYDETGVFPEANFATLAQHGLIALTVPRALGGDGAGVVEALRVIAAVAKGDPSTALILFMTYVHHAEPSMAPAWPARIYDRLVRDTLAGRGLIGGLRVEPELGTPSRGGMPKTVATRTAEGWLLNGRKIYATGSTGLDWYVVWARTEEEEPRTGYFLVPTDTAGITIVPTWDHLGMRATVSHDVTFEDTPIPADHAVDVRPLADWAPKPGDTSQILWNALVISTIYDGVARAARDWLRTYLKERVPANLGKPLAELPRVQEKFGEIEALLHANQVLIDNAARRADAGDKPSAVELNLVKHIATANAIRAVEIGLELTGNPGVSRHNPLQRHYRDVLCSRIHSPQSDTILLAAGKAAFAA